MESYLTFRVLDEAFAVHVSRVMEIREYEKPRPVPQKVGFVPGVIEFREEVIPLINTGIKFNLGPVEASENSVIIILDLNNGEDDSFRVAILVDAVSDVIEMQDDDIKSIRHEYKPEYVAGSYSHDGIFVLVIDSDQVFTKNEVIEMDKILSASRRKK